MLFSALSGQALGVQHVRKQVNFLPGLMLEVTLRPPRSTPRAGKEQGDCGICTGSGENIRLKVDLKGLQGNWQWQQALRSCHAF